MLVKKATVGNYVTIFRPKLEEDSFTKHGEFYFKIVDFGADLDERKSYLEVPPDWLKERFRSGREKQREDYIKTKIWLRAFKSLVWESKDLEGKCFIVEKN